MASCPNINHPDWKLSVRLFGLDYTLYLYDKLGQIPDRFQISEIYRDNKGDELNDLNNPSVWDIEDSEDLITRWRTLSDGKKRPVKKAFTSYKAAALIKQFSEKYPEASFKTYKIDTPGNVNTRIQISVPFDTGSAIKPLYEQRELPLKTKAKNFVKGMLDTYSNLEKDGELNTKVILRDVLAKSESPLLKSIAQYFFSNQKELDSVILSVNSLMETAGEAGVTNSTLGSYLRGSIDNPGILKINKKANHEGLEAFFSTFLHEMMHHYTQGKLNSFQNWLGILEVVEDNYFEEIDQDDYNALNTIQQIADRINRSSDSYDFYGLVELKDGRVNLKEFISEYTTNSEFRLHVEQLVELMGLDVDLDTLIGTTFFKGLTVGDYLTKSERMDFERKKDIMLKTFPWVKEVIEDINLVNMGQLESNGTVIRVNPIKMSKDTLGHEFGHLLIDLIGGLENPLVKSALKQLEGTPLAIRVRKAYADKTETIIQKEILAEAIGLETVKLFKEDAKRNKWEKWFVRFCEKLKRLLGINTSTVRKLANMVLGNEEFKQVGKPSEEVYAQQGEIEKVARPTYLEEEVVLEDVMGELRNKIVDKLQTKLQIFERKGDQNQITALKNRIEDIEFSDSKMEAIRSYIRLAASQTSNIYRQYERAKKQYEDGDKKALNAKNLQQWSDYVSAFDLLEEIELAIIDQFGRTTYETSGLLKSTRSYIQTAISRKNQIKGFLHTEGKNIVAEWLEPHVSRIAAEYKLIYEKEWLKMDKNKRPPKNEYIESKLTANQEFINTNVRHRIKAELDTGAFDIGYAYRMGETILDSDDIVIGAMVKAFAKAMDRARRAGLSKRKEIVDKLRRLEEISPQTAFKSAEEFYSFLIEKDKSGNYTNKLVGKFRSEFWEEREEVKRKAEETLQEALEALRLREQIGPNRRAVLISKAQKAKEEVIRMWTNTNAPIDQEGIKEAKLAFIDTLLTDGRITTEEHTNLQNAVKSFKYIPLEQVIDNDNVIGEIERWNSNNIWNFRNPIEKWESKQYDVLMKLDQKDPRREFYDLIKDISDKGDKYLPFRYRLRQFLPFMPKKAVDRLRSGQGMYNSVKAAASDSFVSKWFDTERGQLDDKGQVLELIDENNNPKMFLPVFYTPKRGKSAEEQAEVLRDQSFDISTIYYNWYKMAMEYKEKSEILAEMELTKHIIENRAITKLDSQNNPIKNANDRLKNRILTKSGHTSMIAAQLNDWFESVVYGKGIKDEGTFTLMGKEFDKAKTADKLNKYTAYNLLGLNMLQGVANKALGEIMQITEMFAGEFYTMKDYFKASKQYNSNLAGILGDVGSRQPKNIINLLVERFDILNDYSDPTDFEKSNKFRQLMTTNTAFFLAKAGEHSMQSKAMLAILNNMNAFGKNGRSLKNKDGSDMTLFDAFSIKDGELELNKEVDLTEEQLDTIGHKMKRLLSRMHGEYSELGKVALQRTALGRMAYMFRKFMVQGWKRRMEVSKRKNTDGTRAFKYNEVGEFFTEGAYRSTARYLRRLVTDWTLFKNEARQALNSDLTSMEMANIRRTLSEVIAFILIWTMSHILIKLDGDDDDDNLLLAHGTYQLLRLKSELAFFVNPLEAMKILRSPAASMSVLENVGKALALLNPFDFQINERFQGGTWEGHHKISKYALNAVPVARQGKRMLDIENQLNWFK